MQGSWPLHLWPSTQGQDSECSTSARVSCKRLQTEGERGWKVGPLIGDHAAIQELSLLSKVSKTGKLQSPHPNVGRWKLGLKVAWWNSDVFISNFEILFITGFSTPLTEIFFYVSGHTEHTFTFASWTNTVLASPSWQLYSLHIWSKSYTQKWNPEYKQHPLSSEQGQSMTRTLGFDIPKHICW